MNESAARASAMLVAFGGAALGGLGRPSEMMTDCSEEFSSVSSELESSLSDRSRSFPMLVSARGPDTLFAFSDASSACPRDLAVVRRSGYVGTTSTSLSPSSESLSRTGGRGLELLGGLTGESSSSELSVRST